MTGYGVGCERALSFFFKNFGFDYLKKISLKQAKKLLIDGIKRENTERRFELTYHAVINRYLAKEALDQFADIPEVTKEEAVEMSENIIAKFAGKQVD